MLASPVTLARWMILTGAGILLGLILAASWLLRDQIFQTFQDPGEPFQTYTPPPGADYASAEAWYARGDFTDADEPAVFFVHPTTYSGGSNWVGELDKASTVEAVERSALPNYAAPFANSGVLFAPRYRQASLYTLMNNREDSLLAREFAYGDVRMAFEAFLAQIGEDRPILLAGVGQGGFHVLGLLMERVSGDEDLRARLIAAYVLETPVPLDLFTGPLADIPPCETPADVRCVMAYSYVEQTDDQRIRILTERMMTWTAPGQLDFVDGRGLLCVNPILGTRTDEYASARLHRGAVAAEGLPPDATPAPLSGQTGAQCADGLLFIEPPTSPALQHGRRLAEEYRVPPFNLFYEDLRLDAARRSLNLITLLQDERRWAPPIMDVEDVEDSPVVPIPDRREY
ncbi:DUF3089 domain-containing protein [Maricaulis parjimensis]|uniref:DUF3089 domain-containing protein n=1 Tax=Maricaulis parjimensis TaxID=144023 RepID=UPI001939F201|nr:DUF3089 domain-containing protein [Maricaulis parjimensis]